MIEKSAWSQSQQWDTPLSSDPKQGGHPRILLDLIGCTFIFYSLYQGSRSALISDVSISLSISDVNHLASFYPAVLMTVALQVAHR